MSEQPASDVTCRSIMATDFPVLSGGMKLIDCVKALLENRVLAMPVVDEAGAYLGVFRKNLMISAILPQVAVHDPRSERVSRMIEAGLLTETMWEIRRRFSLIAADPVRDHVDSESPVLRPDQPLVAAMFCLFHGRNFLPVVETGSNRLVGTISAWDVMESIIN
jgi:CBS-domain-containing membrane protein